MLVSFEELPENARLWVYQANRKLSEEEQLDLQAEINNFIKVWTAHGQDLGSASKIIHDQFLVIGVDEDINQASGCSIDASVHFIQEMEKKFSLSFTDRSKVAFLNRNGVFLEEFTKVRDLVDSGVIGENTITFNNTVSSKGDFDRNWKVEVKNSWLKKYFP